MEISIRLTLVRNTLMATSRIAMSNTGTKENTCWPTSTINAPRTRNLSASGSRNAPELVVPSRRARCPSSPSELASAIQINQSHQDLGPMTAIPKANAGAAQSRRIVNALAGVAIAEGPNAGRVLRAVLVIAARARKVQDLSVIQ